MKRKYLLSLALVLSAAAMTGCQKDKGDSSSSSTYDKYVTLGEYTGLTADRTVTTVTDADVQEEIDYAMYDYAEYNDITDRAAQEGDTVNIDYTGTIDGEEFDGGSDTDTDIELGTETFLADFEDAIVGMKVGETKEFEVTFPEDYDGVVDGQTATFSVTLNSITETVLPEYNDAYVKENFDYDTTAEYENAIREELQDYYNSDAEYTAEYDLLSQVVETSTFDGYPEELYETTKSQVEEQNNAFADQFGMTWEELVGEDYDIEDDVLTTIHEELVVYAIADKEGLTVSDEEYDSYVDENWEYYEYDSKEDFLADVDEDSLKYSIIYDKVLEFLGENNTFNDVEETEDAELEEELDISDLEDADEETEEASEADTEIIDETDLAEETEAGTDE